MLLRSRGEVGRVEEIIEPLEQPCPSLSRLNIEMGGRGASTCLQGFEYFFHLLSGLGDLWHSANAGQRLLVGALVLRALVLRRSTQACSGACFHIGDH